MYEYKCKIVKVIDGDTVDVDIDLGFGVLMCSLHWYSGLTSIINFLTPPDVCSILM